jgi:hypothetical protein
MTPIDPTAPVAVTNGEECPCDCSKWCSCPIPFMAQIQADQEAEAMRISVFGMQFSNG